MNISGVAAKQARVWTYDDIQALPADGMRYEIIDGELYVSPSPNFKEQVELYRLEATSYALHACIKGNEPIGSPLFTGSSGNFMGKGRVGQV